MQLNTVVFENVLLVSVKHCSENGGVQRPTWSVASVGTNSADGSITDNPRASGPIASVRTAVTYKITRTIILALFCCAYYQVPIGWIRIRTN